MTALKKTLAGLVGVAGLTAATPAFAADFVCTAADVTVFRERVHVRCTTQATDGTSKISFFAVPTTDAAFANRFLSTATTALVSGRQLVMKFTNGDTSGSAWGCGSNDCRSVWGFGIQ